MKRVIIGHRFCHEGKPFPRNCGAGIGRGYRSGEAAPGFRERLRAGTLVLAAGLLMLFPAAGHGLEKINLLPLQPAAELKTGIFIDTPQGPQEVSAQGTVERLEGQVIVISDLQRAISSLAVFKSAKTGLPILRSAFKVGAVVGYRLNKDREIDTLWLIEAGPP